MRHPVGSNWARSLQGNSHFARQFYNSNDNLTMKNGKTGQTTMIAFFATCETLYTEVINFLFWKYIKKSLRIHWKSTKKFQALFINVDFTKLSIKNFPGRQFFQIPYLRQFWNLEYQGRKIINPSGGIPPEFHRKSTGFPPELLRFLSNERRAQESKDLTKQRGLLSIFFWLLQLLLLLLLLL